MRSLALLAFGSLLLAGCSGTTADDPGTSSTPPASASSTSPSSPARGTTGSGSASPTSPPRPNQPPSISAFAAQRPDSFTLAFDFTFTAADPDGDNPGWSLDADGDGMVDASGTALPGRASYAYASAGLYTARLTVSDGKASDERTLSVNATLAPRGPIKVLSAQWTVGIAWCMNYPFNEVGASMPTPTPTPFKHGTPAANVLYGELNITPDIVGHRYDVDFGAPFNDTKPLDTAFVVFYDAEDAYLGHASTPGGIGDDPAVAPPDPLLVSGTIPADAAFATLFTCANPEGLTVDLVVH